MLAVFDDAATLRHALAFESALAQAQADLGLIPADAAAAIASACASFTVLSEAFAQSVAHAGTLAIALVSALRERLPAAAAAHLHVGTTSQDVADTVLALQIRAAAALLAPETARLVTALAGVARKTASTPTLGRTLLQDAQPIGFGLRVAHWAAGIGEAADEVSRAVQRHAVLQLGGAAGTRAGLNGQGHRLAAGLAARLNLPAAAPWHARRGGMAAIGATLAIYIGALAKMARDVSLLAQNCLGEVFEPQVSGRGGSSAMPHKRNPTGSQVALSAATRAPGLAASLLAALPAELERGLGGWQAEAPVISELFLLAAGSVQAMTTLAEGLIIDEGALAAHLQHAELGNDIGESAAIVAELLDQLGRAQ